jgi:dTDP-4-dehydrorhamnose reductase
LDVERNRGVHGSAGDGRVVIVGAAGQLGLTMAVCLGDRWPTVRLTRRDLDLTDAVSTRRRLTDLQPVAIINCAGYNQVDQAEREPEAAMEANAFVVRTLARAAAEVKATLVHYSSDFVFDGVTDRPYREDDRPGPRSVYAASKLLGEWFAVDAPSHYVLRVESLFGGVERRKSSFDRIIDAIAAANPVKVFIDRVVSPSYAWDIAEATHRLLVIRPRAGLYHCVNTGHATWHDLAVEVARQLGVAARIEPISVDSVTLPAPRPQYSALSNAKLREAGIDMPTWQDAVGRALVERRTKN